MSLLLKMTDMNTLLRFQFPVSLIWWRVVLKWWETAGLVKHTGISHWGLVEIQETSVLRFAFSSSHAGMKTQPCPLFSVTFDWHVPTPSFPLSVVGSRTCPKPVQHTCIVNGTCSSLPVFFTAVIQPTHAVADKDRNCCSSHNLKGPRITAQQS